MTLSSAPAPKAFCWLAVVLFWFGFATQPSRGAGTGVIIGIPQPNSMVVTNQWNTDAPNDEERRKIEEETRREILRVTENDPAYASARCGKFAELVLLPGIVLMLLIVLIRRGAGGCM